MLPYKNRLIEKKDFEAVHRSGKFFSFGLLALKIRRNELGETRIGLAVGIKFSKKAIKRNRIKRQLREVSRLELDKIKSGFDIVIMVKKTEKGQDYWELESAVRELFQKAGVLK